MSDESPSTNHRIRDRQVLLVAAAVVVSVLALRALSDYVPAVADLLGFRPVLIVGLIAVTALVLIRSLLTRRGP